MTSRNISEKPVAVIGAGSVVQLDPDVDIQLDFLHRVDGVLEEGANIYRLLTRWNITRSAFFQFNYSIQVPTDSERTDLLNMSLNVSV